VLQRRCRQLCLTPKVLDFTADFKRGSRTVLERFVQGFDTGEWTQLELDPAWYAPSSPRAVYKRLHAEAARQRLPVPVVKRGQRVWLTHEEIFPQTSADDL
jgi:hypothetical protein